MARLALTVLFSALLIAACGESAELAAAGAAAPTRGGSIRIGEQSWTLVPSIQCSVFPGGIVAIAGHAESDPALEIVIDADPDGPTGVRVGSDGGAVSWHAVPDTLALEIEGKQVRGTATFSQWFGGGGETATGEFRIDC